VDIADVPKTFPDTKVKGGCAEASQLGELRTPITPKEGSYSDCSAGKHYGASGPPDPGCVEARPCPF